MRLLLTTLLSVIISAFAFGQVLSPVHWKFSVKHVSGDEYDLIYEAKMDKGWTIYSQQIGDGGPVPTSYTFDDADHYERVGEVKESDNAKSGRDKIFEMQVTKFYEYAKFTQRVKARDISKPVIGYLEFMTCDDEKCLAPQDVEFELKLPKPVSSSEVPAGTSASDAATETDDQSKPPASKPDEKTQITSETRVVGSNGLTPESIPVEVKPAEQFTIPTQDQTGIEDPVTWSFYHEKITDDSYKLIARADIEKGWHIYTQHIDPEKIGPVPTTLVFEPNEIVKFEGVVEESGPERKKGFDKFFQMDLVSYKTQAFFSQIVKTSGQPTVTGELEFATCNEEMCLPPDYVAFAFDLSKEPGFVSGAVVEQLSSTRRACGSVPWWKARKSTRCPSRTTRSWVFRRSSTARRRATSSTMPARFQSSRVGPPRLSGPGSIGAW
jgi:thiol:disulfide interchange protein DsbD